MKKTRRKGLIAFTLIAVVIGVIIAIRFFILSQLKSALSEKLQALNETSLHIRYDSMYVDWINSVITVDSLLIEKDTDDTSCIYPEYIAAHRVRIDGFNLFKLAFTNELNIDEINIEGPYATIREHSRLLAGQVKKKNNDFLLSVDLLRISDLKINYTDSASCKLRGELTSNAEVTNLSLAFQPDKPFEFAVYTLQLHKSVVRLPDKFYTFNIQRCRYSASENQLQLDTIRISPHLSRLEFGRKTGFAKDRIEGVVPFLKLSGFKYQYQDTLAFSVKKADIQMFLKIFRDKRLPHKMKRKLLPIPMLHQLSFGVAIDTFTIQKSFISYEEIAAGATEPGLVFFDDLSASVLNISNDRHILDGETKLKAQAAFMGAGDLQIETVLPWQTKKNCLMRGTLKNFAFARINTMLKPSTPLEITSGTLKSLAFTFTYNLRSSKGEAMLEYHDLKLITYKTDHDKKGLHPVTNNDGGQKDNLKTFLLNAFIIRKNMDEKLPEEKRTGIIDFHRDETRSIFHYWWKSLFSGIQSAFRLDRIKNKKVK